MTDCFGPCRRLFERGRSATTMGTNHSKRQENAIEPDGDNTIQNGPINLLWIDYCFKKNGRRHQTDKYYSMRFRDQCLVVRRGMPICFYMKFDREFDINNDNVSFVFKLCEAEDAKFGTNTMVAVPLKAIPSNRDGEWSAYVMNTDKVDVNVVSVRITPPPNCIVGKWMFDVDTRYEQEVAVFSARENPFYIIFNPWCPTDEVYMAEADLREEYVLNQEGLMWRGTFNQQRDILWDYNQFEPRILDYSFHILLKVRKMALVDFSDPIQVCRNLSAAINAPDDSGVIVGNWTEDFSGGTPPYNWVGSLKILDQFMKTKKPVKYGQCWVYAGVLTTVCRSLGIPCRPVTAYSAAHDTQKSLTIDYMVDNNGAFINELINDSVWNYHVWNEVWMARPDLNMLDRSWQVIDATPQETSDNQYKCGPASVTAVKNGDIRAPYDTAFVYSEVNADKVFWKFNGYNQPMKFLRKDTETIGKLICTKAVGKDEQENITDNYKYREKTEEERSIMVKALRQNDSIFSRYYLNEVFNEIRFDFELVNDIYIGEDFRVAVKITNRGHKDYTVNVVLRVDITDSKGKNGSLLLKVEDEKVILHDPGSNVQYVEHTLTYFDYFDHLQNQATFKISCLASVAGTNYEYFEQETFQVRKPVIDIKIHNRPILGEETDVTFKMKNTLPIDLKDCVFRVGGTSIAKSWDLKIGKVISKKFATATFKFTPRFEGKQGLSAKFSSKQLSDVDGYKNFFVQIIPKRSL